MTLEEEVKAALEKCPFSVRVREGGGEEDLGASVAVTLGAMQARIEELRRNQQILTSALYGAKP